VAVVARPKQAPETESGLGGSGLSGLGALGQAAALAGEGVRDAVCADGQGGPGAGGRQGPVGGGEGRQED
jgi:hypothetical protein